MEYEFVSEEKDKVKQTSSRTHDRLLIEKAFEDFESGKTVTEEQMIERFGKYGWGKRFMFRKLETKYGKDFNWGELKAGEEPEPQFILDELNKETKLNSHFLHEKAVKAVARCYSNDDCLFLLKDETYAIVHLIYSENLPGWPHYQHFDDLTSVLKFIEANFVADYL